MKKRLLSALLALSVLCGSMPVYALEDTVNPAASTQSEQTESSDVSAASTAETAAPQETPAKTPDSSASEQQQNIYTDEIRADLSDVDAPDNDELFETYLQQLLYGESGVAPLANWGETTGVLNEYEKIVYDTLKDFAKRAASGEASSAYEIPTDLQLSWSFAELGISGWEDANLGQAVGDKMGQTIDLSKILNCLLVDCPADLYWFDKTFQSEAGTALSYRYGYTQTPARDGVAVSGFKINMVVAEDYRKAGSSIYDLDSTRIQSAQKAMENAGKIVAENAGKSDYEKLVAYRDAICASTSYNTNAANGGASYGDPWQLVYVFDGDASTNVVCEGYSKAFQYLCDMSGINCYTVTGLMDGGTGAGLHMWNIVPVDGLNYLVDVTNCDSGTIGYPDQLFMAGATGSVEMSYTVAVKSGSIQYTYDSSTRNLYGDGPLTLSADDYDPNQVHTHTFTEEGFCACGEYQPATEINGVYQINNAGNLFWFAALVNGDKTHADFDAQDAAANAVLTDSIHLNKREWTPIGCNTAYTGHFDGQNNIIYELNITAQNQDNGLFGAVGTGGIVERVQVQGWVQSTGTTAAGICASLTGGTIRLCSNRAEITNNNSGAGGICGVIYSGTVENCDNSGIIQGNTAAGGISGANYGTVRDCYSTGVVTASGQNGGGIVGRNLSAGTVENCYYLDTVADTGIGNGATGAESRTLEQFYSGEVTYLLNHSTSTEDVVWHQFVREDMQAMPVRTKEVPIVYYYDNTYSNIPPLPAQDTLTVAGLPATVTYGDTVTLTAEGGSGTGALQWSVTGAAQVQEDGTLTVTGVGPIQVTVTKASDGQYAPATATADTTAQAKALTVTAATAQDKPYDGTADVVVTGVTLDGVVADDAVAVDLSKVKGTLPGTEAGDYDRIKLEGLALTGEKADCYTLDAVADNVPVTVSIGAAQAGVTTKPVAESKLTYSGGALVLVQPGEAEGGTLVYSLSADGPFTAELPTATQAGTYTVWYKVEGDGNHTDSEPQSLEVTVAKAAAPALEPMNAQHRYTLTGEQTLSVAGRMPGDAGALQYTADAKTDAKGLVSDWSVAEDGTVRYTLTGAGAAEDTATLTVKIGSENYADATVQIVLTMTAREVPTGTVNPITHPYDGKAVAASEISGTMSVPGTWSWKDKAPVNVPESGSYTVLFTPDDDKQYAPVEMTVQVTITKVLAAVTEEPQLVQDLTYNGEPQTLVTAGAAQGGQMQYAVEKEGPYQLALPTATDAGTYEVWYIVIGDENHENIGTTQIGTVTIAKADPDPEIPTGLTATYGDTLADVQLPEGWTWNDPAQSVGDAGSKSFAATFSGDGNYNPLEKELTVTVAARDLAGAEVTLSETVFTYNGQAQKPEVTAVTLEGASLQAGDYTVAFDGEAVHAGTVTVTVTGTGNYAGTVSTTYTIAQKAVEAVVTVADKVYDATTDAVVSATVETVVAGDTITISGLTGTFDEPNVGEARTVRINTGAAQIVGAQDYNVTIPQSATAAITPAVFRYTVADQQVRIGNGMDTVNAADTANGVASEKVNGTLTWYQDEAHTQPVDAAFRFAGKAQDIVTLYWVFTPAAEETNYTTEALNGSANFTLAEKEVPQIQVEGLSKMYDGRTLALEDLQKSTNVGGTWAFAEGTPEVKNVGDYTVTLTFTPDDTQNYATTSVAVPVSIAKRPVVVRLQLTSNRITVGDPLPEASVVYYGVVEGESLVPGVQPVITGLPEKAEPGVHPVRLANANAMKQAIEALDAAKNYEVAFIDAVELTINEAAVLPGSDEQYRLEATPGVEEVPESLIEAGLETETEIFDTMYEVASRQLPGTTPENTELHDVELFVSTDGGSTWVEATPDNFPEEGLTVTLPYPEGTNASDYDFAVTHMFTVAMNGKTPGQVESPAVSETAEGIRFTVTSLSPITLSWKVSEKTSGGTSGDQGSTASSAAPSATPAPSGSTPYYTCPACGYHDWTATDAGYRCDHCGYLESVKQLSGYGNVEGVYEPKSGSKTAAGASTIAQTGDESHPMLWAVVMFASAAALCGLALCKRKRRNER